MVLTQEEQTVPVLFVKRSGDVLLAVEWAEQGVASRTSFHDLLNALAGALLDFVILDVVHVILCVVADVAGQCPLSQRMEPCHLAHGAACWPASSSPCQSRPQCEWPVS